MAMRAGSSFSSYGSSSGSAGSFARPLSGAPRARTLTTPPGFGVRRGPAPLALVIYGALSLLTLAVAFVRAKSPIDTESWLELPEWSRHLVSVLGGGALAVLTVRATRTF